MLANCDRIWQIKVPIFYLCLRIAQFRLNKDRLNPFLKILLLKTKLSGLNRTLVLKSRLFLSWDFCF